MYRKIAGALGFLAVIATMAWAANGPTYRDSGGFIHDSLGVTIVNPDGSFGQLPTALGASTTANSVAVTLPSDAAFGSAVSVTRTNDTSPYSANDVIGTAPGSTAALTFTLGKGAGQYYITSAALEIDASAIISGETSYSLYLYNVTPPSALGDNAAFDIPSGDRASFLGKINLGSPIDEGSTLYIEQNGINKQITTASGSVFGYLVTVGAYTPTAQRVSVVTLHSVQAY